MSKVKVDIEDLNKVCGEALGFNCRTTSNYSHACKKISEIFKKECIFIGVDRETASILVASNIDPTILRSCLEYVRSPGILIRIFKEV